MNTIAGDMNPAGSGRIQVFAIAALAGAALGAGLVMLLAPRAAAEARRTVAESARAFGEATAEGYKEARAHVVSAINDATAHGQDVRNDVADSVAYGAREVARAAVAAKAVPPFRQL